MDKSAGDNGAEAHAPLWRVLGVVLFVALLLGFYYVFHKPLPLSSLGPVIGVGLDLLAAGLVLAAGLLAGRAVTGWLAACAGLDLSRSGRAVALSVSGLLGLALLSAAALALGLTGLFTAPVLWVLVVAPLLLGWRDLSAAWADFRAVARAARPNSRFAWFLCTFVIFELALAVLMALAPPVIWDALTYHLVEPQRGLAAGRILGYADNFYLGLPKLVETLFGVAMGLFGRDTAAAPVHFGFGLLGLLAVMGLAKRWTGRAESGWLAAALLLGGYSTWALFGYPYVDLAVFAYAVAAFACALAWEHDRQAGWLLLGGLLVGSAFGVKYTSAPAGVGIALLVLVRARRAALRPLLMLSAGAILAYLPWALRGLLLYGNPIYPYIFGGLGWNAEYTAQANQMGRGLLSLGRGWQLLFLPLAASVFGGDFEGTFFFTAGPWLLTLPFTLLFTWSWLRNELRRSTRDVLLLLAPPFAVWAVVAGMTGVGMQTRLAIGVFPLMALLGALALDSMEWVPRKPLQVGFIVKALIGLTLVLAAFETIYHTAVQDVLNPLLGIVSPEDHRAARLGPLNEALEQLDDLPEGSGVRFLFEPRGYPCRPGVVCRGDTLFHFWNSGRLAGLTADAIFADWAHQGDTHVLFFANGYQIWMDNGSSYWPSLDSELPAALALLGDPVWVSPEGWYALYRLPPG